MRFHMTVTTLVPDDLELVEDDAPLVSFACSFSLANLSVSI